MVFYFPAKGSLFPEIVHYCLTKVHYPAMRYARSVQNRTVDNASPHFVAPSHLVSCSVACVELAAMSFLVSPRMTS
jgi:hypothetical protein